MRTVHVAALALLVALAASSLSPAIPTSHAASAPAPGGGAPRVGEPYDPFAIASAPALPRSRGSATAAPRAQLAKPAGVDLDVTLIGRTPRHQRYDVQYTPDWKPYLRPGTEADQRWPAPGELVTFTAHIVNKGTLSSGKFAFSWLIDGLPVRSGTHASLAPGSEATEIYQWAWAHTLDGERLLGEHTVRFVADPANAIHETFESNNSLEDRTDALSLALILAPELYAALETPRDPRFPFSAEDWLQYQIAAMNAAFARSVFPSAPHGLVERVRVEEIVVASSPPPPDLSVDGGYYMGPEDRRDIADCFNTTTAIDGCLLHELSHQIGIIDMYQMDIMLEVPQVLDRYGRAVQMEYWTGGIYPGIMNWPMVDPPVYDEHTTLAMNSNKGYRRGYYGEYLYDLPAQASLRVFDNRGQPAPGVTVRLYQRELGRGMYGSNYGIVDDVPEIVGTTDGGGRFALPNRTIGGSVTTHTGHTLRDNPFGIVDVVGRTNLFIVELSKGDHQEFSWLNIVPFNLVAWRSGTGDFTVDIASHVPPPVAPPPTTLRGIQEQGLVKLVWAPGAGAASYNLYRARNPAFVYQRVLTATTDLSYADALEDRDGRAADYAVTAVDAQGREGPFSNIFYALSLLDPSDVAVDDLNNRIVLDTKNGYALLYQAAGGDLLDTRGGTPHLEHSRFLARDSQGRLIVSHPGDWYTARHSIRVYREDGSALLEFGQRGAGPGQLDTPAGVAAWGGPSGVERRHDVDPHTLLLLHFDGSYDGAQGEVGSASGAQFAAGKYGQGVLISDTATLSYLTAGNLNPAQGAVEFWFQPGWSGAAGDWRHFFDTAAADPNVPGTLDRLLIINDYWQGNNITSFYLHQANDLAMARVWGRDWHAGQWYHIAATWRQGDKVRLYVNGAEIAESDNTTAGLGALAERLFVGSSYLGAGQARGVIDELRISDTPRVGGDDNHPYRILVADSGNNRIQAFDWLGHFVSSYGIYGDGPGQFKNPQGLAVAASGQVVVADTGNRRLQVLSFDGERFGFVRSVAANFNQPTDVAAYGASHIVVTDAGDNTVKLLDSAGKVVSVFAAPNDGRAGAFSRPHGVAIDRAARIVVADTGNRRVVTIEGALPRYVYLPLIARTQ